jgi:hypothetical protein
MVSSEMLAYYRRVLSYGWGAVVKHGRTTILAIAGAVLGVVLLAILKINPTSQTLLRTIAGITWPLLLLVAYILFYLIEAPWELHKEDAKANAAQGVELETVNAALNQRIADDAVATKYAEFSGKIWILKHKAREIRRSYPLSDFNKRPFFMASWVPPPDSTSSSSCLKDATDWHEAVFRLDRTLKKQHPYLNSLDFNEAMEFLDDADREFSKLQIYREIISGGAPNVQVARWDQEGGDYGFFIRNHGGAAVSVWMPAVSLGSCLLESEVRSQPLLKEHGEVFFPVCVMTGPHSSVTTECGLPEAIKTTNRPNLNGLRLPIPMRVVFQDALGMWYATRHEMGLRDDNSVSIAYINQESLAMPPCIEKIWLS